MSKRELLEAIYDKLADNTNYDMFDKNEADEFYINTGDDEPSVVVCWEGTWYKLTLNEYDYGE